MVSLLAFLSLIVTIANGFFVAESTTIPAILALGEVWLKAVLYWLKKMVLMMTSGRIACLNFIIKLIRGRNTQARQFLQEDLSFKCLVEKECFVVLFCAKAIAYRYSFVSSEIGSRVRTLPR